MNAIGTQLCDPINSGLTRWRMATSSMDAAAELGRNPVSKHHIKPEYGDEQADAGRHRLNPSRETKFSGTHGDRGIFIFPVQLTTSRIGNLTRLIHTLLYVMTIHTYRNIIAFIARSHCFCLNGVLSFCRTPASTINTFRRKMMTLFFALTYLKILLDEYS